MHHTVVTFIVTCLVGPAAATIVSTHACAQTQPGSIGGTIGQRDKSVSGGEERIESHRPPLSPNPRNAVADKKRPENAKNAACMKIVGTWNWVLGGTRIFLPTGRVPSDDRGGGTWTCSGDNYVFKYADGSEDRLKLSPDGDSMSGVSSVTGFAINFTVHRR
jgi:hypothetical protein